MTKLADVLEVLSSDEAWVQAGEDEWSEEDEEDENVHKARLKRRAAIMAGEEVPPEEPKVILFPTTQGRLTNDALQAAKQRGKAGALTSRNWASKWDWECEWKWE